MSRDRERRGDGERATPREPLPRRPSRGEIDEEIEHHLRGRIEELVAAGYAREAAEREARRRFGSVERARRRTEGVYRPRRRWSLAPLGQELIGALRSLRHRPAFTLTATLLLAVGMGTTTTMLAVLNAYLFRGMPYPHAERLMAISTVAPPSASPMDDRPPSLDWRELPEVELAVGWDRDAFTLVGDGRPEEVGSAWVSPDFFPAFGVEPTMGRGFTPDETGPEAAAVAIISHDLWQTRFGGDEEILGRTLRMYAADRPDDAQSLTIVGVLPPDWWHFFSGTDVLTPLPATREAYVLRLAPGVEYEEAQARLNAFAHEVWGPEYADWGVGMEPIHDRHVRQVRPLLGALGAGVALVLLIACANVAVLLLVQATGRAREFALRAALGAGRGRLVLRLLLEAAVLSVAGVAGGALGILGASRALAAMSPTIERLVGATVPGGAGMLTIDARVALLSVGATAAVTLLFGLAPLAAGVAGRLSAVIGTGARGATVSARQHALRTGLIVVELALSLALLAGAGLMVRSALHMSAVDLGFEPHNLLRIGMGLSTIRYPGPEQWSQRIDETLQEFASVPGVESVAGAIPSPFAWASDPVTPQEGPLADADPPPAAAVRAVSAAYFRTMGIELQLGRTFETSDRTGTEPVAIVSDRLAAMLWPGESAIGRRLRIPDWMGEGEPPLRRIVGVVADTREGLTGERELPDAYVPLAQAPFRYVYVLVRSAQPADTLIPTLERRVWDDDPEQPLSRPAAVSDAVRNASETSRALARMLVTFAAFGVVLAVIGVYGVIAFAARQRRQELAIRVALGAQQNDIRRLLLGYGLRVVFAGVAIGLGAAWALGRALASQVHGVSASDPVTLGAVMVAMAIIALGAVLLPARRAALWKPMDLLREE